MSDRQFEIYELILEERLSQDREFGDQSSHSDLYWLGVLVEEIGAANAKIVKMEKWINSLEAIVKACECGILEGLYNKAMTKKLKEQEDAG